MVYLFSIIGYMFFKDDFLVQVDDDVVFGKYAMFFIQTSHMYGKTIPVRKIVI